ncbi:MAG: DUF4249 domain-containing protein [Rhodothermaceae bacterium]|nr:DUF4249 domain-containing protein [Rhodothermaceae bacterium]MYG68554.1 DUF4249 domain-containing protein [Rhodothermaceae bacterium]MYJ44176.1 DUF4249 domain-containing protein [Rhodothermaceae bacterium]
MYRLFALILFIPSLGCEAVLEIELERVSPEIVVTAVFTENQPWQVLLQRTVAVHEEGLLPSTIEHAAVSVHGNDGSMAELVHKGGGFYYGDTSLPQSGVAYTLSVEVDGYARIHATDQIPAELKVQNVQYEDDGQRMQITLEDEDGVNNYYAVSIFSSPQIIQQSFSVLNAELSEQMKQFAVQDPFTPYSDRPQVDVALIHDKPFDGKQFDLSLDLGFGSEDPTTHVRSVSKAYYDYFLSRVVQGNIIGSPFAEPAPLKSNVRGGQGIFAGYTLHVEGDLSPENIKNRIIGTYYRSEAYVAPSDPDAIFAEIEFSLHQDHSVTGSLQYPSPNGSGAVISLDGGYTIIDNSSRPYFLVQLHHGSDTFFRNVELKVNADFKDQSIYLTTDQTVINRNGGSLTILRTFVKRENSGDI